MEVRGKLPLMIFGLALFSISFGISFEQAFAGTCPEGTSFSSEQNRCVGDDPVCPSGMLPNSDNTLCVSQVQCPGDSSYDSETGKCKTNTRVCPDGSNFENGVCRAAPSDCGGSIAHDHLYYEFGQCNAQVLTNPSCPAGTVANWDVKYGTWHCTSHGSCDEPYHDDGSRCYKEPDQTCPTGYNPAGSRGAFTCSKDPACKEGINVFGTCKGEVISKTCPDVEGGYYHDEVTTCYTSWLSGCPSDDYSFDIGSFCRADYKVVKGCFWPSNTNGEADRLNTYNRILGLCVHTGQTNPGGWHGHAGNYWISDIREKYCPDRHSERFSHEDGSWCYKHKNYCPTGYSTPGAGLCSASLTVNCSAGDWDGSSCIVYGIIPDQCEPGVSEHRGNHCWAEGTTTCPDGGEIKMPSGVCAKDWSCEHGTPKGLNSYIPSIGQDLLPTLEVIKYPACNLDAPFNCPEGTSPFSDGTGTYCTYSACPAGLDYIVRENNAFVVLPYDQRYCASQQLCIDGFENGHTFFHPNGLFSHTAEGCFATASCSTGEPNSNGECTEELQTTCPDETTIVDNYCKSDVFSSEASVQDVIDDVNEHVPEQIDSRMARALLWLLNAALSFEEGENYEMAKSKLNSFESRVNLFMNRGMIDRTVGEQLIETCRTITYTGLE